MVHAAFADLVLLKQLLEEKDNPEEEFDNAAFVAVAFAVRGGVARRRV